MGKRGKREFVQVLRLLEVFRPEDVLAGVREAIARGAIGFDAVKHLVLCRIERRPPRLDLRRREMRLSFQVASAAPWFAPDSALEGDGFEPSVPERWLDFEIVPIAHLKVRFR
jgi:hypothetical protein